MLSGLGMFAGLALAINGVLEGRTSVGTIVFLFSVISFFNSNVTQFLLWLARLLERNLYVSDIVEVIGTKTIIKEIKTGMKGGNYEEIPDRKEAIVKALNIAKAGDIVVIAGKGHEDYQITDGKVIHFDDKEIAGDIIKQKGLWKVS